MGILVFTVLIILMLPATAWAWGPAAHLDFGLTILDDISLLAPVVADLLSKHPLDFLYGSIAADITIGKNLSPYYLHCHNWQVGLSVRDLAKREATRAFAWGYLAHLAADVVAHNYFIPYKLIQYYNRRRAPHAYWEIRFDTRMRREAWQLARKLATQSYKQHDQHLRDILTGPLFPFSVNKQLFNSMVLFNQIFSWKRMVDAHAQRTKMVLSEQEVAENYQLAIEKIRQLMGECPQDSFQEADPTGHRNLLIARDLCKRLRSLNRQDRLLNPGEIGLRLKPLFLESMNHTKLNLPSFQDLIDPLAPPKQRKAKRLRMKRLQKHIKKP